MNVKGIIPARYKSSRFPGKPLVHILGKPLVIHVAEKVEQALGKEHTIIATDDLRISEIAAKYGYQSILTTDKAKTGTDRLWEVAQVLNADIYVNIQGDEPMVDPNDIVNIVNAKIINKDYIINGMCNLSQAEDPNNINIPKVLVNSDSNLVYMSRLPIPGVKDINLGVPVYKKQVCIYAFTYEELKAFGTCDEKAYFEHFEDIEILRFLDLGHKIKMVETRGASLAVDVPEDVLIVERAILNKS